MLDKSKYLREPLKCESNILIGDVRQNDVRRHGAIPDAIGIGFLRQLKSSRQVSDNPESNRSVVNGGLRALHNLCMRALFAPNPHGVRTDTEDVPILLHRPK